MLLSLHIENVAVIKKMDVDFFAGFTAITGETGAGKTVLIDCINLLLGAKAERELVRSGESSLTVRGLFGGFSDNERARIAELGADTDEDGTLLIQRTVALDGRSQVKINGTAANIALLKRLSTCLFSIHGQTDTNSLTDAAMHREVLDTYASIGELLGEYSLAYTEYEGICRQISDITEKENERERLKEILEYQIKDIEQYSLVDGEEEELVDNKVKIRAGEKITKNSEFVYKALRGSEKGSVAYLVDRSISALSQLTDVIPAYADYSTRLREVLSEVEDIAEEVYAVIEDADVDPTETLNKIEARLEKISKLKRKYGLTVRDILDFRDRARAELDTLVNSEELLMELGKKKEKAYATALALAERLHAIRCEAAAELEKRVKETLEFLDMPKVVFFASINERTEDGRKKLNPTGTDEIEFFISANRGAEPQSIAKIASGGELARIMLALKSVIADKDGIMTVIFDEIDAGVSGKTARKIGIKMRTLSETSQLLCVTHSAQIASLAHTHYLIKKSDVEGKTESSLVPLDREGRIRELSRILGGINVTEAQRAAAMDMLSGNE